MVRIRRSLNCESPKRSLKISILKDCEVGPCFRFSSPSLKFPRLPNHLKFSAGLQPQSISLSYNVVCTASSSGYFWEVACAATAAAAAGRLSAPATTGAVPWARVAVVWRQSLSLCRRESCTPRAIYRQQLLSASALPAATVTIAVAVPNKWQQSIDRRCRPLYSTCHICSCHTRSSHPRAAAHHCRRGYSAHIAEYRRNRQLGLSTGPENDRPPRPECRVQSQGWYSLFLLCECRTSLVRHHIAFCGRHHANSRS